MCFDDQSAEKILTWLWHALLLCLQDKEATAKQTSVGAQGTTRTVANASRLTHNGKIFIIDILCLALDVNCLICCDLPCVTPNVFRKYIAY